MEQNRPNIQNPILNDNQMKYQYVDYNELQFQIHHQYQMDRITHQFSSQRLSGMLLKWAKTRNENLVTDEFTQ